MNFFFSICESQNGTFGEGKRPVLLQHGFLKMENFLPKNIIIKIKEFHPLHTLYYWNNSHKAPYSM